MRWKSEGQALTTWTSLRVRSGRCGTLNQDSGLLPHIIDALALVNSLEDVDEICSNQCE